MQQFKRDKNQNSTKLYLDKYYTPTDLAKYCISKTYEVIGRGNITEIIEPSAGNGSFSNQIEDCIAYDIEPEDENIIKQDFLQLEISYEQGRLIIGNPPFGEKNNLVKQFYNKSIELAEYISFILPIKFYNNSDTLYKYDLIYSEDLGLKKYSDRDLHCCFNIYEKPMNKLNKKPNYKLKSIDIISSDPRQKINYDDVIVYDLRMVGWGAKAGKVLKKEDKRYSDEYKIIIKNDLYRDKILEILKDGIDLINISTPRINKYTIYKYIKEQIPEIE